MLEESLEDGLEDLDSRGGSHRLRGSKKGDSSRGEGPGGDVREEEAEDGSFEAGTKEVESVGGKAARKEGGKERVDSLRVHSLLSLDGSDVVLVKGDDVLWVDNESGRILEESLNVSSKISRLENLDELCEDEKQ